jgi:hypothetical protein
MDDVLYGLVKKFQAKFLSLGRFFDKFDKEKLTVEFMRTMLEAVELLLALKMKQQEDRRCTSGGSCIFRNPSTAYIPTTRSTLREKSPYRLPCWADSPCSGRPSKASRR